MSVCTVTSSPPAVARTPTPCTPSTRRSRPPRGPPTCPPSPHPSTRAGTGPRAKVSHYFITSRENSHGNQGALFRKIQPIDPVDHDSFILRIGRLQISISTYFVLGVFIIFSCQSILYFSKYFPCSRTWHVQGSEEVIKSGLKSVQIRSEGNKTGPSPGLRAFDQVKSLKGLICSQ